MWKENNQQKHQFKSYYCAKCRQSKPCEVLTGWSSEWKSYCCACYYEGERDRTVEYSSLEKVLSSKQKEKKSRVRQLLLLRSCSGCPECGSLEVDAYSLYEKNKLVCQPCLMRKEGSSSSPISFCQQRKWYKKRRGVDISWWLETYQCLPVNADCADKWLRNKEHLPNKCDCLERETEELYSLFTNSLREMKKKLKECQCEVSSKVRVDSDDWMRCERCKGVIKVASKKRVIKNRNDPRFWGIGSSYKILCLGCIGKEFYKRMSGSKRKVWREYRRRGYL